MKKALFLTLTIFALCFIIGQTSVYAGYSNENTDKGETKYFTNLINFNDNVCTTYSNSAISNTNNSNNSIIIIEYEDLSNINFQEIINKISNENYEVLIGYSTLEEAVSAYQLYEISTTKLSKLITNKPDYVKKYNSNGYMKLFVDGDKLSCGDFFTTAKTAENLLKNYNMFSKNLSYDVVENSVVVNEISTQAYASGNYTLKFYDSSNTTQNKIYSQPNTSSTRITSVYRGEAMQDLNSMATRTYLDSYGGKYVDYFQKVQVVNSSGSYQTGYFYASQTYDPQNGDEGWISTDWWYVYADTLYTYLDYNYVNNIHSAADDLYVIKRGNYYGINVKKATSLYDSSNNWIRAMSTNSYIWISPNTNIMCGYSHPSYMTISAWSSDMFGTINACTSTTFINANLQTAHPSNYNINVRWW